MCIEVFATYVCGHTLPIWIPCSYYSLHNCPNYQRQYRSRPLRCSATCRAPDTSSSSMIDEDVIQELTRSSRALGGDGRFARETVPSSTERSSRVFGSTSNSTQRLAPAVLSQALVGQSQRAPTNWTEPLRSPGREENPVQYSSSAVRSSGNNRRPSQAWTETSSSSSRSGYSP